MLALLALEVTTRALQCDGPSTTYAADKELGLVCEVKRETRETMPVPLAPSLVRVLPPVHVGWDNCSERIYCIATHTCTTADAWAHVLEKLPMGISGAIAT